MTTQQLHPDWPAADPTTERNWDLPVPVDDLAYALTENPTTATATFPSTATEPIQLTAVDRVVRYHISYHDEVWTPTNGATGSELSMYVVGQLTDGRWFSVVAWNDYTGWGCQDGSDVRIGDTEDAVVRYGLDEAGRRLLGYAEARR